MRNVTLVGFMGTGKTTIAKMLSEKCGMQYVSTDELVEKREKTTISEIFMNEGEPHFRKLEKDAVRFASGMNNVVIDAGGGAILDPENVQNLKKGGIMVCLFAKPETILERTKNYKHRPLLNVENPIGKIRELLAERKGSYEKADFEIDTSSMKAASCVEEIERIMENAKEKN